eukprot:jgi/Botrbrau1/14027/Bobra.0310s0013.1
MLLLLKSLKIALNDLSTNLLLGDLLRSGRPVLWRRTRLVPSQWDPYRSGRRQLPISDGFGITRKDLVLLALPTSLS